MLTNCPCCRQPWAPPPGAEAWPCEVCSAIHIAEEGRGLVDAMQGFESSEDVSEINRRFAESADCPPDSD